MEPHNHDHRETLFVRKGIVMVKARVERKTLPISIGGKPQTRDIDYPERTLKSMVEGFIKRGAHEVAVRLGPKFHWDVEEEELPNFDAVLLEMLEEDDDEELTLNEKEPLTTRLRLIPKGNLRVSPSKAEEGSAS